MDKTPPTTTLRGSVVEDELELTVRELCRACNASQAEVETWVVEGLLQPRGGSREEWRFAGASLTRVRVASRLARDLEINASGVALVMDLLERIAELEARLVRKWAGRPRA